MRMHHMHCYLKYANFPSLSMLNRTFGYISQSS